MMHSHGSTAHSGRKLLLMPSRENAVSIYSILVTLRCRAVPGEGIPRTKELLTSVEKSSCGICPAGIRSLWA